MLFRSKNERDATTLHDLPPNQRSQIGQLHYGLFRLAVSKRSSAEDERAFFDGVGKLSRPLLRRQEVRARRRPSELRANAVRKRPQR